jgi:hypothetical protein
MKAGRGNQGGWTQIEVLLAGFLGLTLVLSAGYLFTTQIRGYKDIKDQAKLQSSLKKALQGMTRQIANAGACLPNPLDHFGPEARKITFAYVDVRGTFCDPDVTVILSFRTQQGNREDTVVEDIQCVGGPSESKTIASAPHGGLDLSFRYLDKNGMATAIPALIKSVQLNLGLQTEKAAKMVQRTSQESIRVQLVNLI